MKKIIAILMTLIMMLSMVACSKSSDIAMNVDNMKWEEILEESKGSTVTFYGWGGDEDLNAWLDNVFAPKMKEKYDIIGDVRGIGGMLGVEFVKDKESKEPNPEFVSKLVQTALQKGLLLENAGSSSNVIRFLAPLCMTEEQMEAGLKIFEESILANL